MDAPAPEFAASAAGADRRRRIAAELTEAAPRSILAAPAASMARGVHGRAASVRTLGTARAKGAESAGATVQRGTGSTPRWIAGTWRVYGE
jgi:hypothetical protein